MFHAGHPLNQAIAAAYSNARRHPRDRGGIVGYDAGGGLAPAQGGAPGMPLSMADPWWAKSEANTETHMLQGPTAGRADAVRTSAPSGAYIIPADVISGLGEGNSLAGARVMQEILNSGPYGTTPVRLARGSRPPRAPAAREPQAEAKGGDVRAAQTSGKPVPVLLSHGEMMVSPRDVMRQGRGDLKRGHRVLDMFVVNERKKHIAKLKKLPGPVKS